METPRILVGRGFDNRFLTHIFVVGIHTSLNSLEPWVFEEVVDGVAGGGFWVSEPPCHARRMPILEISSQVILHSWPRAVIATIAECAIVKTDKIFISVTVIAETSVKAAGFQKWNDVVDEGHEDNTQAITV